MTATITRSDNAFHEFSDDQDASSDRRTGEPLTHREVGSGEEPV
jgi:hypothetical protein